MRARNRYLWALLIFAALAVAGLIWLAGDIFALFLVAFLLAYLLNPLVDRLVRAGMPRSLAALSVTLALVVIVAGLGAVLGPLAYGQMKDLFHTLRNVASATAIRLTDMLAPYIPALRENGVAALLKPTEQPVSTIAGPIAARVFSGSLAVVSVLALALLTPIITYYLLKDWPAMIARIETLVPERDRASFRTLTAEMHGVLSAFLHGQAWVCVIDAVLFSTGLLLTGLQYGLLLGILAGALKFLPYVGTIIGLAICLAMALGQSAASGWLLAGVAITFAVVEAVENMLYPRLVGQRVRLPPAMVIFAVLLGGKLLGIIGVFVAVPTFAVARVAVSFWLRQQEPTDSPLPTNTLAARPQSVTSLRNPLR